MANPYARCPEGWVKGLAITERKASDMSGASLAAASALEGFGLPFTAAQWKELEHQALIYKHLVAGLPVPHDLVILIQRSFDSSASFLNHPGFAHSSYYGKKFDLEPSRCRRTDGKKWRCSRIAYPDSRYCVRHMHRGRNRSRKHVESPSTSQSSSAVISQIATGMSNGGGSLQNDQLHSVADAVGPLFGSIVSKLQMELTPYAIDDKVYFRGLKADECNLSQAAYGSVRDLKVDSYVESRWQLTNFGSHLQSDSPQLGTLQDFELIVDSPMSKQEMQYCPFDSKLDLPENVQQEHYPMRPFLAEKPNGTDSWFDLDYQRSNKDIFTTQLSMSIPVATSEVYSRNICLPSGESSFLNPLEKSSR